MNPFSCSETKENFLFNIKTGRRASEPVTDFLLNVEENGQTMQDLFITECSQDVNRFEAPIKQNKILNFASCNNKKKITVNNKVREVRMQRDLFGRMLGISMKEATDIEKMLSYPMTPIPTSLCHLDGTICKTEKSVLLKNFRNDGTLPPAIDVVIVDGFFLIHCIKDVPKSFGNISKKILQILCSYDAPCIHIVFDRYCRPSVKDYERSLRGGFDSDYEYVISGTEQTRPTDFSKELRNDKFKEALVDFLISHWQTREVGAFMSNKTIVLNYIECYTYQVNVDGNVVRTANAEFRCSPHEEADTKIIYHAFKIDSNSNIVIKCSDTDIVVILLANLHKIESKIWIECGISDKRHIINVNALHESLGLEMCKALPGFHALTGCDYNPAFFRKGKQRPYKMLLKSKKYQTVFADLGNTDVDKENTFSVVESFVCDMYGIKSCDKVNKLRYELFRRNYTIKNINESFQKKHLKNFDASCLPPCYMELRQQMERAHYIANIWTNATLFDPYELEVENCGWVLNGSEYEFKWFEGPQLPPSVKDVVVDSDKSEAEDDDTIYDSDEDIEFDDIESDGYSTE